MAVTDAVASVFAAELIAAYPEAKVVLNYRRDLDAWSVVINEFCYIPGKIEITTALGEDLVPLWLVAEMKDLLELFRHQSAMTTLVRNNSNTLLLLLSCLGRECFWAWHVYVRFMWPGLFRALDGNLETGVARNGKWVYRGKWIPETRVLSLLSHPPVFLLFFFQLF